MWYFWGLFKGKIYDISSRLAAQDLDFDDVSMTDDDLSSRLGSMLADPAAAWCEIGSASIRVGVFI